MEKQKIFLALWYFPHRLVLQIFTSSTSFYMASINKCISIYGSKSRGMYDQQYILYISYIVPQKVKHDIYHDYAITVINIIEQSSRWKTPLRS